ncbi:MAG TPA: dihydroorotase [Myxococcaceae bacterium]|nr:dihydroorotase [Myxococcaceae bacterium]
MSGAILIRGGRLIDPHHGVDAVRDVLLRGGKVAEISERPLQPSGASVIDAAGKWVAPGFIDVHVHLREPGEEGKETILTGARAAVAGGFTAIVAMPNTVPPIDSGPLARFVVAVGREANLCRVYPSGAITRGQQGQELADIAELVEAGCVCVTDDGRPVMNAGLMRRALQWALPLGIPIMVHEEDLTLSHGGAMNEGRTSARLGLAPIPRSAEVAMVARDLVLAAETGGRVHFAHLSCEDSVRLVREAKRRGLRVTAEAAPHHFTLSEEAVDGWNTHAKMNPPLRSARDVEAVREGLADGTIDAIATDHAPHGVGEKSVEFELAPNGVVGLETAVPLALELVTQGVLDARRAVALLSAGPATAFGLPGGQLGVGAPADVTIVDPAAEWTIEAGLFFSKARNTPFEGRKVRGRVVTTLVGGRVVFQHGEVKEPG